MKLHAIASEDLVDILTYPACIDVVEQAMQITSAGEVTLPLRHGLPLPNGMMGMMYGYLGEPQCFGIKLVSLFPGNAGSELSSHMGLMVLYEAERGQPLAIMDGGLVTAIRTAAASASATRALAREDATTLAIIGAGEQAEAHLSAIPCVRNIRTVHIWARDAGKAQALAEHSTLDAQFQICASVAEAVSGADVVCTVTSATEPLLFGRDVDEGTHVNLVGSSFPDRAEADSDLVARARYFVDYKPSTLAQAGEYLTAVAAGRIDESHILAEIGEVTAGRSPGRKSTGEITVYKSLGVASQDLAAARYVYEQAVHAGRTQTINI